MKHERKVYDHNGKYSRVETKLIINSWNICVVQLPQSDLGIVFQ